MQSKNQFTKINFDKTINQVLQNKCSLIVIRELLYKVWSGEDH